MKIVVEIECSEPFDIRSIEYRLNVDGESQLKVTDRTEEFLAMSQERATATTQVRDLAMLLKRLLYCEKSQNDTGKGVAEQAWDYLKRNDLMGSPMRETDSAERWRGVAKS